MHLSSKQQSTFMSMNTPNVSALTTNKPTIVHVISGLGQGGAETVLYRLLSATKSGFHHHVISLGGLDEIGPLLQKEGIEVQALGLTKKTLWTQGNKLFLQALRQINPNVIQTWMYHSNAIAGWWAYRAGYHDRIVWNIRNSGQHLEEFSFISRLSFRFGAWLSRRIPTAIVSCAHSAAKKHRQLGYQGPEITVIPNGVDTEKWHPNQEQGQQQRAQMRILPDMPVIGVVARWHPLKDYPNFLQALGQLIEKYPNVKCLLLGDRSEEHTSEL